MRTVGVFDVTTVLQSPLSVPIDAGCTAIPDRLQLLHCEDMTITTQRHQEASVASAKNALAYAMGNALRGQNNYTPTCTFYHTALSTIWNIIVARALHE
eukprot:scaffold483545_cov22-Prasinocladus_malaysianus.AAC.1